MQEDDRELRETLKNLAPTVGDGGVWTYLQKRVAARRRTRRRLAMAAGAAVVVAAALGLGAYGITQWWPHQNPVLVIDAAPMIAASSNTSQSGASSGTWQELSLPQSGYPVCNQLVMDPADSNVLYAATDVGLFVSRDGAVTWVQAEEFGGQVLDLLVDPGPPSAVYVGFSDGNGGIRFEATTDRGATWQEPAALEAAVKDRMLLAAFGSVLYARGSARDGTDVLAKSSDGGNSWEDLALPAYAKSKGYVFSLRTDPRDSSRLYLYSPAVQSLEILANPGSAAVRVFVSGDGARTWSQVKGEELDWAKAVATAAPGCTADAITSASALLKAVWESPEYGINAATGKPFSIPRISTLVAVDPANPSTLYVGADTGIYKSTDQGKTWNDTSASMRTRPQVHTVVVDPLTPSTLYVTTKSTIVKSTDDGLSWASLFPAGAAWSSLAIAPSSPSTLYVWGTSGLSRSDDGGATWAAPAGVGLPSLQSDQQAPGTIPGQGVVWDLLISSASPETLLANTVDGIFRSTDGGNTWARPSGLPEKARGDQELVFGYPFDGRSSLFQARGESSVFYAVLADRSTGFTVALFASRDGGRTWGLLTNLGNADAANLPFAMDTSDPLTIYAQTANFTFLDDGHIDGVSTDVVFRRWTDAGSTWTKISTEGPGEFFSLYVDQWTDSSLYALARPMGFQYSVCRSANKGDSWDRVCDVPDTTKSLVPGPEGVLYAVGDRTVYKWTPSAK